jgi:hypothetical protein
MYPDFKERLSVLNAYSVEDLVISLPAGLAIAYC